jgi:alcohol dehydrogenase class IV
MKDFNFHMPTKIVFGPGKIKELTKHLTGRSDRILLVTDKMVAEKSGALKKISAQVHDKMAFLFDEVEENPSLDLIEKGRETIRENPVQLIIGIGGGSSMDAAKGMAVLATNHRPMTDYMSGTPLENDPLPVICIPTSSGTGSEVTPFAVFTDKENENKEGYAHEKIFPILSIIDPELTYSMPEPVIANTGIDVLTHAIESYLSTESFLLNDQLALHAIEIALQNLEPACRKEKEAMNRMAYASMAAGIAITHGGTILLHIMGYPLTVYHQVPHGRASGILLPEFMRFMGEKSFVKDKVKLIEDLFQGKGGIEAFVNGIGISTKLSDYGVKESELDLFARKTIVKGDIKITPAEVSESDILDIYRKAMV